MLFAVVFSLTILSVRGGMEMDKETWGKIHRYNLLAFCYGEQWLEDWTKLQEREFTRCSTTPTPVDNVAVTLPFQLTTANLVRTPMHAYTFPSYVYNPVISHHAVYGKKKREAAEMISQEDMDMFNAGLVDYMSEMETKIGNLSCVLQGMGIMDAAGNIDRSAISYENLVAEMGNTKAGSEPGFIQKLSDQWNDCLDVSNAWPQTSLNRNEFMMKHGRQHIFFMCMKKTEVKLCGQFQMAKYVESYLGNMPGDKFDNAMLAYKVLLKNTSPEMKFLDDFFWGEVSM